MFQRTEMPAGLKTELELFKQFIEEKKEMLGEVARKSAIALRQTIISYYKMYDCDADLFEEILKTTRLVLSNPANSGDFNGHLKRMHEKMMNDWSIKPIEDATKFYKRMQILCIAVFITSLVLAVIFPQFAPHLLPSSMTYLGYAGLAISPISFFSCSLGIRWNDQRIAEIKRTDPSVRIV